RGTHVNISGAGVTRSAPHRENAIRFLEFLVTPEAQAVFVRENFEYPVVEGVPHPAVLDGFGPFVADVLDVTAYGRNNPAAVMLMDRAGWRCPRASEGRASLPPPRARDREAEQDHGDHADHSDRQRGPRGLREAFVAGEAVDLDR